MMKALKNICAIVLASALLFSVAACAKDDAPAKIVCWTASSNEKIILDKSYPETETSDKTLTFKSAKGEYESAQLIVTPDKNVRGVDLKTCDLKCGDAVIPAENIEVYFEKYYRLDAMSSPQFPVEYGSYPDALVPLDAVQKKGEDTVAAGCNQGLWVTVEVPADAAAGQYAGNFLLNVAGQEINVPVSVRVWDFVMPQENHMQTIFNNFREHMMNGELDNSEQMIKYYTDWLLDYHISLDRLPLFEKDVRKFVELAKEYAANPKCACYGMNLYFSFEDVQLLDGTVKSINETDWHTVKEYLYALAEASTPELNLLTKLNLYDQSIDEPEGTGRVAEANYKQKRIDECKREVVERLEAEKFDFAAHGIAKEDILSVEYVVTNRYAENLKDMSTYCPLINDLNSEEDRAKYERLEERDPYNSTWWYVAWQPQYPYPNFRVEESSVGLRSLCWMQMDYDIEGFLYWGTSVYSAIEADGFGAVRDPYTDPYPFLGALVTNDGQLTYPGRPYGIYGPVPSIRLMAYRDGAEDYEYLWYLRSLLEEANATYEAKFDFDAIMRSMYDSLYSGTIPNYNADALETARAEVAGLIELLESDANAVITVDGIDSVANKATYSVYASAETKVEAKGAALVSEISKGSGKMYVFEQSMSESVNYASLTFTTGGKETAIRKYLGKKTNAVSLFAGNAPNFTVSEGFALNPQKHITVAKGGDGTEGLTQNAAKIEIREYTAGTPTQTAAYSPYAEIPKSAFGNCNGSDLGSFGFNVYAPEGVGKKVKLLLVAGGATYAVGEFVLKEGVNSVLFEQIYLSSWNKLGEVTAVRVVFEKADETPDVYYLDNVFYTTKD